MTTARAIERERGRERPTIDRQTATDRTGRNGPVRSARRVTTRHRTATGRRGRSRESSRRLTGLTRWRTRERRTPDGRPYCFAAPSGILRSECLASQRTPEPTPEAAVYGGLGRGQKLAGTSDDRERPTRPSREALWICPNQPRNPDRTHISGDSVQRPERGTSGCGGMVIQPAAFRWFR